jgi:hypothetical protein
LLSNTPTTLEGYGITDALSGTVGVINGGTGITSYNAGDILYSNATNTLSKLPIGAQGQVIASINGVPTWTSVNNILFGNTGEGSYTIGNILYADSTTSLNKLSPGNNGQILAMVGGLPSWTNINTDPGQKPMIHVGLTPPTDPLPVSGDIWFNNDTGQLLMFYQDVDTPFSEQWIDIIHARGQKGEKGDSATISLGTVTTINPNISPSIQNVGNTNDAVLNFNIPRASTISIGQVTTGDAGSAAGITNSGQNGDVVLDFQLPGTPTITIGDTITRSSDQPAVVTNSGNSDNIVLDFEIPIGKGITNIVNNLNGTLTLTYGDNLTTTTPLEIEAAVVTNATPPLNPRAGDLWWDPVTGRLKVFYIDPDLDGYWIDAFNSIGPRGAIGPVGPVGPMGISITDIIDNSDGTISITYGNNETSNISFNGIFATQEEVNLKAVTTEVNTELNLKAPIASPDFTGTMTVPGIIEKANVIPGAANNFSNIDVDTSAVWYFTSPVTNNWSINFRASSSTSLTNRLPVGGSLTIAVLVTNGSTPYRPTGFTIDSSSITPRWQGGSAPTSGNANSTDIYTFSIVRTSSGFVIFASQTRYA